MYRMQVFDFAPTQNRWRDVDCINEDECGALYAFVDSRPLRLHDVGEAKEIADAVAANTGARVGVFDEELEVLAYDARQ
jgi:hypothetical protein